MNKETLKSKIENRIKRSSRNVFLRKDFASLGGYDQVGRALKSLEKERKIQKIAYGVYAKSRPSSLSDKAVLPGGFGSVAKEALDRLGVKWKPGSAESAYARRETTQVPAKTTVKVEGRFSRKIASNGFQLNIER